MVLNMLKVIASEVSLFVFTARNIPAGGFSIHKIWIAAVQDRRWYLISLKASSTGTSCHPQNVFISQL